MNENIIRALKFPDNVRQNPSMMLGDLSDSSILLREIFDNSRDETLASSSCNSIWIQTNTYKKYAIVADNGRGIPVTLSNDEPTISQMELAAGNIFAGGKFDAKNVSGGLHGVGMSCVNAVSETFHIACKIHASTDLTRVPNIINEYYNNNELLGNDYYLVSYNKGVKYSEEVIDLGKLNLLLDTQLPEGMNTIIGFIPDSTMVKSTSMTFHKSWYEYTFTVLKEFYNKEDISIVVDGKSMKNTWVPYKYIIKKTISLDYPGLNEEVKFLINWEYDPELCYPRQSGSVNLITVNDGLHCQIAQWVLNDALKKYFKIDHKYYNYGLIYNCIILAKKVGYNSQTKEKLVKISDFTDGDWYKFENEVFKVFNENYDEINTHVQRLNEYNESLQTLAAKDYIKSMITINGENTNVSKQRSFTPLKLKDCSSPNVEERELMICEGDSAGTAIMSTRDPRTQAVLPLRGKSLNTIYKTLDTIFENQEIRDIISAIGMGVDDYNNLDNSRYGKIIIVCDADTDGGHIASLLMGLFCYHMSFIIENGLLYMIESPIYKQGDRYIYPGEEDTLDTDKHFERFKGLGSLSTPELIEDVITNKDTRRLVKITMDGIDRAIKTVGDRSYRKQLMINYGLVDE